MKKILFPTVLVLLWILPGYAHQLWIFQENNEFVIARGHMPDKLDPYDPQCIKEVKAYDKNGNPVALERKEGEKRTVFCSDGDVAAITARCDWGFRVNTTQGKKLISRKQAQEEGLKVINAFFSTQFSKTLYGTNPLNTKPLGLKLEIIALKNPFEIGPEELLPVQVRFDEKPLADTVVSTEYESVPVKTDQEGIARIKIAEKGLHLISARHKVPVKNDPEMDYQLYTTFLVVEEK